MEPLTFLLGALALYRYLADAPPPTWTTAHEADIDTLRETLAAHREVQHQHPELSPLLVRIVVSGALHRPEAFDWAADIYQRAGLAHVNVIRPAPAVTPAEGATLGLRPVDQTTLNSVLNWGRQRNTVEPDDQSIADAVSYAHTFWTNLATEPSRLALSDATADALIKKHQREIERWLRGQWTGGHCWALEAAAQLLTDLADTIRDGAAWLTRTILIAFGVPEPVAVAISALAGIMVPVGDLTLIARGLRVIGVGLCAANGHLGDCACRAGLAGGFLTGTATAWLGREIGRHDWSNVVFGALTMIGIFPRKRLSLLASRAAFRTTKSAHVANVWRRTASSAVRAWTRYVDGATLQKARKPTQPVTRRPLSRRPPPPLGGAVVWRIIMGDGAEHATDEVTSTSGRITIRATRVQSDTVYSLSTIVGLPGVTTRPGPRDGEVELDLSQASASRLTGTAIFASRRGNHTARTRLTLIRIGGRPRRAPIWP
jgi:hypothetical protein